MAKVIEFTSEGSISPKSTPVRASTPLGVENNDAVVHSVVWDDGSPDSLINADANGQDIAPDDGVSFDLTGVPPGTWTFHDGHNAETTGQIVVT